MSLLLEFFFYLSKACETVDYNILLTKLDHDGIRDRLMTGSVHT